MLRSIPFNPMHSMAMKIKLSRKKASLWRKKIQKTKYVEISMSMSASRNVSFESLHSPLEGNIRWFIRFTTQETLSLPINCSTAL